MARRTRRLLPAARAVSCGVYTTAMYGACKTRMRFARESDRPAIWDRWYRRWARNACRMAGLDPVLEGPLPSPPSSARLVVANHRSAADIPILLGLFGGRILSRADLGEWPVIGALAKGAGTLFVDRDKRGSGAAAIRALRSGLRGGDTLIVFPEGTTYPGDEVRPFFAGAFTAAKGLEVELIPVGLAYPPEAEWWKQPFPKHWTTLTSNRQVRVGVARGAPRRLEGNTATLTKTTEAEVQALVHRARLLIEAP